MTPHVSFSLSLYAITGAQAAARAGLPVLGVLVIAVIGPTAGRWYVDVSCGVPPKQFVRGEWFVTVALLTGIVWVLCDSGGLPTWASARIAFIVGYTVRTAALYGGETCGRQLALEHNGDLYSCDHYVEPGYLLGNIGDRRMLDLIASPPQVKFGQDKRDTLTRYCRDCDVLSGCNGGCPKDRFATSPCGEPGQHYLCPSYQDFFRHVRKPMLAMPALPRAERAPAEIMASYAAADARRGRNDPCPCQSGRKWKRCHGSAPGS